MFCFFCFSLCPQAEFRVVEPPVILASTPAVICTSEGDQEITLEGSSFLHVDGAFPTVHMDGLQLLVNPADFESLDDCTLLPVKGHTVHTCNKIRVIVPQKSETNPFYPVFDVTPPNLADCARSFGEPLLVVPPPRSLLSCSP